MFCCLAVGKRWQEANTILVIGNDNRQIMAVGKTFDHIIGLAFGQARLLARRPSAMAVFGNGQSRSWSAIEQYEFAGQL